MGKAKKTINNVINVEALTNNTIPVQISSVDNVNHPAHYNYYKTETIELLKQMLSEEEFIGYLKGNVLKYRMRAGLKGDKVKREEDWKKSCWYQDYLNNYLNIAVVIPEKKVLIKE